MNKPQRLVMSMAPNKHYCEGYNSALDATVAYQEALEDVLRKLLDGTTTKVDTPEELVLRCKAYEVLGDLHASFQESMRMAEVRRKCGEDAQRNGRDIAHLLVAVIKATTPTDGSPHPGMLPEVKEFLTEEYRDILDEHLPRATEYDVDMDKEREAQ